MRYLSSHTHTHNLGSHEHDGRGLHWRAEATSLLQEEGDALSQLTHTHTHNLGSHEHDGRGLHWRAEATSLLQEEGDALSQLQNM